MQTDVCLESSEQNNASAMQEGRLQAPKAHWHLGQQKLIHTKLSTDTCHVHPYFHGNRHCAGQDKARTSNPEHIAKDGANANEQEEINASSSSPVSHAATQTILHAAALCHSKQGTKTGGSDQQKYSG